MLKVYPKLFKAAVIGFIALASVISTKSQSLFTGLNGPYGGFVNDIIAHPGGNFVAATTQGGLYYSTNGGANWIKTSTTDISLQDLEIDGTGKLYALASARLYTSDDAGLNWTIHTNTGQFNGGKRIKKAPNGNLYVATFGQVFKSTTPGGAIFTATTLSTANITDMEVNSLNDLVVSTGGSGIYYSNNNGSNWSPPATPPASSSSYSFVSTGSTFYVLAGDAPYESTDRGDTWTSIKSNIVEGIFSGVLKLDGTGNLYLFNSAFSKFYSTTDQGVNWSAGTSYPIFLGSQAALAQSSTTVFIALANYGIQKTTDGGTIWTDAHNGIRNFTPTDIFLTPNGRLLMGYAGRGFYLSIDDGQTWTFKNSGAGNTAIPINVFAKLSDNSILAGGSGVIRSTDNGTNWTSQHASETIQQLVTANGVNLYGMPNFSFNVKSSVDLGVTWTPMSITGFSGSYATKVVIDDSGNLYFRVLNGVYQVYKVPAGTTVASLLTVPGITTVQDIYAQGNNIYALGSAGAVNTVNKSIDGGTNWTSKSCTASTAFWAYDDSNLFLQPTATGSIQISHDEGTTWNNHSLLDNTARAVDLLISTGYYAYLATSGSVTHKSTNVVIPPLPPTNLAQFGISYNTVYFKFDDNSNNEEYFIIEQSIGDNLNYDSLGNIEALNNPQGYTWYNPFIEPNTTYYYRVRAANGAGKSAYTNEISVTTPAQCVPTIPDNRSWSGTAVADAGSTPSGPGPFTGTNVTISRILGTSNSYTVSNYAYGIVPPAIHPNPGAVTFIENCGSTFMPLSQFDFANGNGTWDPNAGNGTLILKWQTTPDDAFFQGTTTLTLNLTDPAPATPTLNAYIYSGTEVFLNWSKSSFATQYKIFRSDAGVGGPYNLVATINYPKLFHIDKNLTSGSTYYYKISSLNSTGESAQSAQISILLGPTLFRPVENDIQLNTENQQGVSWGDLDGDGDEDIASPSFTNNAGQSVPPVFFENTGAGQFARRDLTILADENTGVSRGIALFDFNNDAMLDMYIIRNADNLPDLLMTNNGNWDFTKTAITESKIATGLAFRGLGIIDYDKDGFADIYVGNDNGGLDPPTLRNFLFKNNGGTSISKILTGEAVTDLNNSRQVSVADYDNDGDQDLFVLNHTTAGATPNRLYRNNGDGTFTKVTGLTFDTDLFIASRTISWGDIDNDSDLDLYVGSQNIGAPAYDRLYRNNGDGTFFSLTSSAVAEAGTNTVGSSFGDIDNDGDLDLIAINAGANSIFINNGSGAFTKSPSLELFTNPNIFEIGAAMADFDQDGFLDIYPAKGQTGVVDLPNQLYKNTNTASASKNWIEVRLVGTASNKSGIGARVKAVTTSPSRTQIREVTALTGYGSQNSLIQHFGLGTATIVNQLEIKWPSGAIMTLSNVAVNQVHIITEDFAGPSFTTLAPANGATNAAATTNLALTLDEPFVAIAGKKLRVYKSSDLVNAVYMLDMSAGVISTNTISFTLLPKLDQSTSYVATLEAGAFSDTYSNLSAAIAASEWSFMTDPGPQVTLFNPAVGATNVSAATKIEITYDRSTTGAAGKNIKLFKSTDLINAIATLDVSTGTVTGNKISFTPPQKLEQNVNYVVTLEAAAFVDGVGNISAEIAASTWNFTTDPGPQVTTLSPANNSTGVAINTNIGLTFNTTVTGVAGKKVNISLASNPGTPVQQIDVGTASIPGNTVSFTLVSPLILFTNYVVTVDAGAFADANGNVTAAILSGWAFKTRDNTPPSITFTPDATLNKGFNSKVFSVTATDGETGIGSVTMYHRGVTATNFTPLPGVLNAGKYDFTVAEGLFDAMGLEYYFKARNADNLIGRSPEDSISAATKYHRTRLNLTSSQVTPISITTGGGKSDYKIISVPLELSNNGIAENFEELGGGDKSEYRFLRYRETSRGWDEYPGTLTTLKRGDGYFVNVKTAVTITLKDGDLPNYSQGNPFQMQLKKGWNEIGNPYTSQIQWSDVLAYNNNPTGVGKLLKYNSGYQLDNTGLMEPYSGGFVQVDNDAMVKIPFKGITTGGRVENNLEVSSSLEENNWEVPFDLVSGEIQYKVGGIGMRVTAQNGKDNFDIVTPPHIGDYIEMNFPHPEHFMKRFTRDVVLTQEQFTWEFTVDTNLGGEAGMLWDNAAFGDNSKELFLFDIARQGLVNMREVNGYSFHPQESNRFRIHFGTNLEKKIKPDFVFLGMAYPNPTIGVTTIPFTLPENSSKFAVRLEVFDLMGRKVATLAQGDYGPGFYQADWVIRDSNLGNGIYTYRLLVGGEKKSEVLSGKVMLMR